MSYRLEKINALIQRYVSEIINQEINFSSEIFITITRVDTTPDLRYTRIFLSVFPPKNSAYIFKTLKKEMYHLQGSLNKKLSLKPLPRIEFYEDYTEAKADEVEKILDNIRSGE